MVKLVVLVNVAVLCRNLILPGCMLPEQRAVEQPARKPKFTVSRETTFVTAPQLANGYVDFAAAINVRLRKGVNSNNNACIPLYEAIGPHTAQIDRHVYLWGPKQVQAFFQEVEAPDRIYKERSVLDVLRPTENPHHHFADYEHPDKRFDDVFRLLHDTARRDRYYSPLITNGGGDGRKQVLVGASYPSDVAIRSAAKLLLTRAKAVSDSELAWQDILASYRLGRLVGMGPEVEDAMLGIEIEQLSILAAREFIRRFRPKATELRRCRGDLANIPVRSPVSAKIGLVERCKCLDTLLNLAYYGDPTTPHHGYPTAGGGLGELYNVLIRHGMGDPAWDPALEEINKSYDEVVRILQLRKLDERRAGLDALERKWQDTRSPFTPRERGEFSSMPSWEARPEFREHMETVSWLQLQLAELTKPISSTAKIDAGTEAAAMKLAGRAAAAMFQPAYVRAYKAEQRTRQSAHNLEIMFALAEFYAVHGKYPEQLKDLVPKYLIKIPLDVFTDQPPDYHRLEEGCLLSSVGENRRDDEGKHDQASADDLAVRMENLN